MKNDLTEFGYIGDISDLIIDLFTGCQFTEQEQRREVLVRRGIQWNEYWEGTRMKLPDGMDAVLCPYVDRYLHEEFTRYIEAWLETDAPAKCGNFSRAKKAIDDYFAGGHFTDEAEFYGANNFLPVSGRQKIIFAVSLAWLARHQKTKKPLGAFGRQVKELADVFHKGRATAAHSPSVSDWDVGR